VRATHLYKYCLIIGAFHAPYVYVTQCQKNRTHAGDEVSETAKAVADEWHWQSQWHASGTACKQAVAHSGKMPGAKSEAI